MAPGTLRELRSYRELVYFLALRDVKVRYKQTMLGLLWAVIQPFFTMVIFTLLFTQLARIPTDGMPAPVFYLSALVPWIFFSSTVNTAGMSLVSNASLLTKIYFPRVILPAAATLGNLLDFLIASAFLGLFMAYYGMVPSWKLAFWPLFVVVLVVLAFSFGAAFAALNVKYRDIKHALPFALQILLFATPIIYPASMVPESYRWLLALNPLTGLIEGFRYVLVPARDIDWHLVAVSAAVTALLFACSIVYFRRAERAFADIV